MASRHTCKYFSQPWRGQRRCKFCNRQQFKVGGEWRWSMTLQHFAQKWLPAISGTKPEDLMRVMVAFPFEFNSHESWDVAFRVWFQFHEVTDRTQRGLGTLTDVMNGWMSRYAVDFVQIDHEAEQYYLSRTGKPYRIGDNAYGAMREVIQS